MITPQVSLTNHRGQQQYTKPPRLVRREQSSVHKTTKQSDFCASLTSCNFPIIVVTSQMQPLQMYYYRYYCNTVRWAWWDWEPSG